VKSKLVKSRLVKSGCGCGCRESEKSGLVMSEEKDHPTATPPTRTSIPPPPAPISEAVNGQVVRDRTRTTRTYSQVVKDLDEDGFELAKSKQGEERDEEGEQLRHQDARWSQECGGSARVGGSRNGS